jgi:hypothetical protein
MLAAEWLRLLKNPRMTLDRRPGDCIPRSGSGLWAVGPWLRPAWPQSNRLFQQAGSFSEPRVSWGGPAKRQQAVADFLAGLGQRNRALRGRLAVGVANYLMVDLTGLFPAPIPWFDPSFAMTSVVLISLWKYVPFWAVLILARPAGIDPTLRGVGVLRRRWSERMR